MLQLPQSTVSRHLKTLSTPEWVVLAPRRHEPLLHAGARRSRAGDPAALGAAARAGEPDRRRRSGRAAAARRPRPAADASRRSSSRPPPGQWDRLREDLFGARVAPAGAARAARRRVGRRRSRLRHGPGRGGAGAVRAAGHRGRSLERHAAGGPSPAARSARTSTCGAASSRRCRSPTASSTPRRCCSCCTTCRIRPRRSPRRARVLRPGGRLLISDMLPHDREEYRQQMGHVWLGFGEDAAAEAARERRLRARPDRRAAG